MKEPLIKFDDWTYPDDCYETPDIEPYDPRPERWIAMDWLLNIGLVLLCSVLIIWTAAQLY